MSDVVEHKPDEHEEEADEGKGRGGADHLCSGGGTGEEKMKELNPGHNNS